MLVARTFAWRWDVGREAVGSLHRVVLYLLPFTLAALDDQQTGRVSFGFGVVNVSIFLHMTRVFIMVW